jgi:hypothetical protein
MFVMLQDSHAYDAKRSSGAHKVQYSQILPTSSVKRYYTSKHAAVQRTQHRTHAVTELSLTLAVVARSWYLTQDACY